jgi:serine/threonine protein kinase
MTKREALYAEGKLPGYDHLNVIAELGQGGFGVVYLAHDEHLDRDVVVKLLHPHLNRPEIAERIKREGQALAKLDHPNIVKVVHYVVTSDAHQLPGLVIEYIDGLDIRASMNALKEGCFQVQTALAIISDVLEGLAAAHERGFIHRDIKPENIMLKPIDDFTDQPVLCDFGVTTTLAVNKRPEGEAGMFQGTFAYAPIEQLEQGIASEQTDLYSVALTFYEMITGHNPYSRLSGRELLEAKRRKPEAASLAAKRRNPRKIIPFEVEELAERGLEPDPTKRPETARQYAEMFKKVYNRVFGAPENPKEKTDPDDRVQLAEARKRKAEEGRGGNRIPSTAPGGRTVNQRNTAQSEVPLSERVATPMIDESSLSALESDVRAMYTQGGLPQKTKGQRTTNTWDPPPKEGPYTDTQPLEEHQGSIVSGGVALSSRKQLPRPRLLQWVRERRAVVGLMGAIVVAAIVAMVIVAVLVARAPRVPARNALPGTVPASASIIPAVMLTAEASARQPEPEAPREQPPIASASSSARPAAAPVAPPLRPQAPKPRPSAVPGLDALRTNPDGILDPFLDSKRQPRPPTPPSSSPTRR